MKCNATRTDNPAQPSTRPSPTSHQAELQSQSDNYTISCRIKDQVGNYGPYTNFSGVVDLTKPTINYAPAQGSTITDNTTLTITSTDDKSTGHLRPPSHGRAAMRSATWNTTVNYNRAWTGTLNGLNANLTDGTITATINAQDWAGNQRTGHHQQLDTQHHNSDIHLRTQLQHRHGQGRKLPLTNRSIHRHTTNRRLVHNNHTALHPWTNRKPSNPETTQESWGWPGSSSSLTSGQIWINVTTTDAFNRTTVDTYTYLIDGEVTSTPTLSIIGSNTILANQTLLDQTHDYDWAT